MEYGPRRVPVMRGMLVVCPDYMPRLSRRLRGLLGFEREDPHVVLVDPLLELPVILIHALEKHRLGGETLGNEPHVAAHRFDLRPKLRFQLVEAHVDPDELSVDS